MEKIRLNFILEDYAIFRNTLNEIFENKSMLKQLDDTKIKSHETELGILTMAELMIQKEDLETIAKTLKNEYNKSVCVEKENKPLLAIIHQLSIHSLEMLV